MVIKSSYVCTNFGAYMLLVLSSPLVGVAACAAADDEKIGFQPSVHGTSIDAAVAEMMERRNEENEEDVIIVVVVTVKTVFVNDNSSASLLLLVFLEVAIETRSDLAPLLLLFVVSMMMSLLPTQQYLVD